MKNTNDLLVKAKNKRVWAMKIPSKQINYAVALAIYHLSLPRRSHKSNNQKKEEKT